MFLFVAIFFGIAPSIIWLLFFLRKDTHPESNRMILKIFFYGMLVTIPAALLEILLSEGIYKFFGQNWMNIMVLAFLYHLIIIALVEEASKYMIVKWAVIKNPEFDEPVDAMLYMIISGLGFAALENILVIIPDANDLMMAASISVIRFAGATFLHALCSGLIGYFLALSFYKAKNRIYNIIAGLSIASLLHGLYNFSIIKSEEAFSIGMESRGYFLVMIPILVLIGLAIFITLKFKEVKKMKSTCKINK